MKKLLLFAVMACAILVGCKKKTTTTDPQTPDPGQDDPGKVDTVYADANLFFYTSSFVYEYNDLEFCAYKENGDSVKLTLTERSTPIDSLGVDSVFYSYYLQSQAKAKLPLDSVKVFETTQKLNVNNVSYVTCKVKATRNSKELDYVRDKKYNDMLVASTAIPADKDKILTGSCSRFVYLYGIDLGDSKTEADSNYATAIKGVLATGGVLKIGCE